MAPSGNPHSSEDGAGETGGVSEIVPPTGAPTGFDARTNESPASAGLSFSCLPSAKNAQQIVEKTDARGHGEGVLASAVRDRARIVMGDRVVELRLRFEVGLACSEVDR